MDQESGGFNQNLGFPIVSDKDLTFSIETKTSRLMFRRSSDLSRPARSRMPRRKSLRISFVENE